MSLKNLGNTFLWFRLKCRVGSVNLNLIFERRESVNFIALALGIWGLKFLKF